MSNIFSVAVDGPSGAGKSSLARRCAKAFNILYVDTGAIYRTVGLAVSRADIDPRDDEKIKSLLQDLDIRIIYQDEEQHMFLNGEDVTAAIRQPEISKLASDVSALSTVRDFLLEMQRRLASEQSVIMDGRDIGTVVLPNADLKIFLTASAEARAMRRLKEQEEKGISQSFEKVLAEIQYRDEQDTNREVAPLRRAEDAVLLDTTNLDFDQSFAAMSQLILERLYI